MKTWITGSGCRITRIILGRSNVYLLSNDVYGILIDTGISGDGKKLLKRLGNTGIRPDVVIMTHTHFDHAGNAGLIQEKYAPLFIVQEKEKEFLESGNSPLPKGTRGWTRFLYNLGAEHVPQWFQVQGVKNPVAFGERYDLSHFGFNACVLHTPGHSAGSSCVIVDDEIALVGDAMAGLPASTFPPWGDDAAALVASWHKLLDTGCRVFHPAHGFAVKRERLERAIKSCKNYRTL